MRLLFKMQSTIVISSLTSMLNPLSANHTKWSNTLKQIVSNLPTNCLSVFDHFVKLLFKGLKSGTFYILVEMNYFKLIWINPPRQEYEKNRKIQRVGSWKFSFSIQEMYWSCNVIYTYNCNVLYTKVMYCTMYCNVMYTNVMYTYVYRSC